MREELKSAMAELDQPLVMQLVNSALEGGEDPSNVLEACRAGMDLVGKRFEEGEYFLMELIVSGKIFGKAMEIIEPRLAAGSAGEMQGKVIIGTPQGDLHDIGKNIVATMLRCSGFQVLDLGVNVPAKRFVEAVEEMKPDIVGMSGLLTTTFGAMQQTIAAIRATEAGRLVKIAVGGGPVNDQVRAFVGADGWGKDAKAGVDLCKGWIAEVKR